MDGLPFLHDLPRLVVLRDHHPYTCPRLTAVTPSPLCTSPLLLHLQRFFFVNMSIPSCLHTPCHFSRILHCWSSCFFPFGTRRPFPECLVSHRRRCPQLMPQLTPAVSRPPSSLPSTVCGAHPFRSLTCFRSRPATLDHKLTCVPAPQPSMFKHRVLHLLSCGPMMSSICFLAAHLLKSLWVSQLTQVLVTTQSKSRNNCGHLSFFSNPGTRHLLCTQAH